MGAGRSLQQFTQLSRDELAPNGSIGRSLALQGLTERCDGMRVPANGRGMPPEIHTGTGLQGKDGQTLQDCR